MAERSLLHVDQTSLVDLLDGLVDPGAAVAGDVVISVAGVDLLYLDLRLLVASVEAVGERRAARSVETPRGKEPQ